jgi:hypothetical protein
MKGHYRESTKDYVLETDAGAIYIKPQKHRLVITAVTDDAQNMLTKILGEPDERESPNTQDAAKWVLSQ